MTQNETELLLSTAALNHSANVFATNNASEAAIRCGHFWDLGKSSQLSPEVEIVKTITYHYLLPVIIVVGVVGNIINLFVLRFFTGKTFAYLFWLAVSDLAALLAGTCWVYRVSSCPTSLIDAYITCHLLHEAVHLFCTSSALIVTTLTAIRFWAVSFPMSRAFSGGPAQTRIAIALCFIIAFILYAPMSFLFRVETIVLQDNDAASNSTPIVVCHVCKFSELNDRGFARMYVSVRETLSRVAPVILVAVLNIGMIVALSRHQQHRSSLRCTSQTRNQAEERRIVVLLKSVMILFIICTTPIAVLQTTLVASQVDNLGYEIFRAAANLLVFVNSALNLYVYCLCSVAIRRRLASLVCQCFGIEISNPVKSLSIERPTVRSFANSLGSLGNEPPATPGCDQQPAKTLAKLASIARTTTF